MSRDIEHLEPDFRKTTVEFLEMCERWKLNVKLICTYRPAIEQARKYRCTRSFAEISERAERLKSWGRPDLAAILLNAGAQSRPEWLPKGHLTMAACGESKHAKMIIAPNELAYSYAFDFACFTVGGSYISDGDWYRYKEAGKIAEDLGLEWLGNNERFAESAHVQAAGLPSLKERVKRVMI